MFGSTICGNSIYARNLNKDVVICFVLTFIIWIVSQCEYKSKIERVTVFTGLGFLILFSVHIACIVYKIYNVSFIGVLAIILLYFIDHLYNLIDNDYISIVYLLVFMFFCFFMDLLFDNTLRVVKSIGLLDIAIEFFPKFLMYILISELSVNLMLSRKLHVFFQIDLARSKTIFTKLNELLFKFVLFIMFVVFICTSVIKDKIKSILPSYLIVFVVLFVTITYLCLEIKERVSIVAPLKNTYETIDEKEKKLVINRLFNCVQLAIQNGYITVDVADMGEYGAKDTERNIIMCKDYFDCLLQMFKKLGIYTKVIQFEKKTLLTFNNIPIMPATKHEIRIFRRFSLPEVKGHVFNHSIVNLITGNDLSYNWMKIGALYFADFAITFFKDLMNFVKNLYLFIFCLFVIFIILSSVTYLITEDFIISFAILSICIIFSYFTYEKYVFFKEDVSTIDINKIIKDAYKKRNPKKKVPVNNLKIGEHMKREDSAKNSQDRINSQILLEMPEEDLETSELKPII